MNIIDELANFINQTKETKEIKRVLGGKNDFGRKILSCRDAPWRVSTKNY